MKSLITVLLLLTFAFDGNLLDVTDEFVNERLLC